MTTNELRIGNYVYGTGKVHRITEINEFSVKVSKTRGYTLHSVDPIPLTIEWLEKLGFEKDEDPDQDYRWWKGDFCLNVGENVFSFYAGAYIRNVTVQYVHQLQNLYYSLTEYEMTLKP